MPKSNPTSRRSIVTTAAILAGSLGGCSLNAYTNSPSLASPATGVRATLTIPPGQDRGNHKALVILALSGGGSRAAYWSADTMLGLADVYRPDGVDLLEEVDVMSSVSGGSLPAAYYAASRDPDPQGRLGSQLSGRVWDAHTVKAAMSKHYRTRWLWNWFWPANALRFWFTAFDRTDVMAQTLADNLFDTPVAGADLHFADLNPERPDLVINATSGTTSDFIEKDCSGSPGRQAAEGAPVHQFGEVFTFTTDDFESIGSNLSDYEISRAVMASATFPGVFNYMTLKDFARSDARCARYRHLFDGGNSDNLGLETVSRILKKNAANYDRIAVILVDSYVESQGVSSRDYDGRTALGYVVDLDFLDSFDSLLSKVRYSQIDRLRDEMDKLRCLQGKQTILYHVKFDNVKIRDSRLFAHLNAIKTDFNIDEAGTSAIDEASNLVFTASNSCLNRIRKMVTSDAVDDGPSYCTYDVPAPDLRSEPTPASVSCRELGLAPAEVHRRR